MRGGSTCATRVKKSDPATDEGGQFWRATMVDMESRLRVARGGLAQYIGDLCGKKSFITLLRSVYCVRMRKRLIILGKRINMFRAF
jgi:hypothetical protein